MEIRTELRAGSRPIRVSSLPATNSSGIVISRSAPPRVAECLDPGQGDRQVVIVEGQDARHRELRRFMDQHALGQPQDDRVGIVGGQELPARRRGRDALAVLVFAAHENTAEAPPLVEAFLDPQRHAVAQFGEFADLDRGAERARPQFELQAFIA